MNVALVKSATLAAVGYDAERSILQLKFRSNKVYSYLGVPGWVHEALLAAPSKGKYFNSAIRGHFPHLRVPDAGIELRGEA
jgi:hypothetical protein